LIFFVDLSKKINPWLIFISSHVEKINFRLIFF